MLMNLSEYSILMAAIDRTVSASGADKDEPKGYSFVHWGRKNLL